MSQHGLADRPCISQNHSPYLLPQLDGQSSEHAATRYQPHLSTPPNIYDPLIALSTVQPLLNCFRANGLIHRNQNLLRSTHVRTHSLTVHKVRGFFILPSAGGCADMNRTSNQLISGAAPIHSSLPYHSLHTTDPFGSPAVFFPLFLKTRKTGFHYSLCAGPAAQLNSGEPWLGWLLYCNVCELS